MPTEESSIRCASRKWPSAARPANLCAYRVVPSFVADWLMMLLQAMAWTPAPAPLRGRLQAASASGNTLGESYDRASLYRGKKSRLRADCCSTSAQPATSLLRDRHLTD